MSCLIGRGRTPEKQAVHLSQRSLWYGTIRSYRAKRVDCTIGRGRYVARNHRHNQPKRKGKRNHVLYLSRNHGRQRV
jgi:hypothetical protein